MSYNLDGWRNRCSIAISTALFYNHLNFSELLDLHASKSSKSAGWLFFSGRPINGLANKPSINKKIMVFANSCIFTGCFRNESTIWHNFSNLSISKTNCLYIACWKEIINKTFAEVGAKYDKSDESLRFSVVKKNRNTFQINRYLNRYLFPVVLHVFKPQSKDKGNTRKFG